MHEFKGLKDFLASKMNEFEIENFAPEKTKKSVKEAIEKVICAETPYWNELKVGGTWGENWSFIEVKNSGNFDKVCIGFCVNSKDIRVEAFDSIFGNNFSNVYIQVDISISDAWLDFKSFYDSFLPVVERSLKYANRVKYEDSF